jgi:hypothetical protein
MDWDDPVARYNLIERLGIEKYNAMIGERRGRFAFCSSAAATISSSLNWANVFMSTVGPFHESRPIEDQRRPSRPPPRTWSARPPADAPHLSRRPQNPPRRTRRAAAPPGAQIDHRPEPKGLIGPR